MDYDIDYDEYEETGVYFMKPENMGDEIVYYIPQKPWNITGFWIRYSGMKLTLCFVVGDKQLINVNIETTEEGFTEVKFFPVPFPLYQVKLQSCYIKIPGYYKNIPMYFTYKPTYLPISKFEMVLSDKVVKFENGRVNTSTRSIDGPRQLYAYDPPKSYSEITQEIGQLVFESKESENDIYINKIKPEDVVTYIRVLIDLGFGDYRLSSCGTSETATLVIDY